MIRTIMVMTGVAVMALATDEIPATSNLITWQGRTVRASPVAEHGQCSPGYTRSHIGWWDSVAGTMQLNSTAATIAECARHCDGLGRCVGFSLQDSTECWVYTSLGEQILSNGVACIRQPEEDAVRFSWEGVQAMFNVDGATSIKMKLASTFTNADAEPRFRVFVDGVLATNLTVAQDSHDYTEYTLVTGLDSLISHQVTALYITDPITLDWDNLPNQWLSVKAFSTDGSFGAPPAQRQRRLQIIGDSIIAANQIDAIDCKPDYSGSYAALLCDHFEANCTTLAISGKGIYRNCCDDGATMSDLYKRSIVGDPTSLYNNSDFIPDAILVNLGTNDVVSLNSSDPSTEWVEGFTQKYADFLVELIQVHHNPALPIFCGVGPLVAGADWLGATEYVKVAYGRWVKEAMRRARVRGVASLHYVDFNGCAIDGCRTLPHPGWVGHRQMFEVAEPMMRKVLGWTPDSTVDTRIVYP